jgi:hypothetical protein
MDHAGDFIDRRPFEPLEVFGAAVRGERRHSSFK